MHEFSTVILVCYCSLLTAGSLTRGMFYLQVQLSEQQSAVLPSSPHRLTIYFMEGGVGTFLPLFFNVLAAVRAAAGPPPPPPPPPSIPVPPTSDPSAVMSSPASAAPTAQPEPIPEVMPQMDNVVRHA